jgi:hypothetical protein
VPRGAAFVRPKVGKEDCCGEHKNRKYKYIKEDHDGSKKDKEKENGNSEAETRTETGSETGPTEVGQSETFSGSSDTIRKPGSENQE